MMAMDPNLRFRTSRRSIALAILFIIIVTLTTMLVSMRAKPKFVTSLSITVDRANRQTSAEYQYDGYYAIQASDLFSQTILSWFLTPSTLLEFYQRAGLDANIESLGGLIGRFRARKISAQNITVQFSEPERARAEALAQAIGDVVKERGESLNQDSEGQALFEVTPANPVIVETKPNVLLATAAAFLASLALAFLVIALRRTLEAQPNENRH
jgi:capsular polysaccharide biosynthesis protein